MTTAENPVKNVEKDGKRKQEREVNGNVLFMGKQL